MQRPGDELIITFGDLLEKSNGASNFFPGYGVRKGDCVMLTLKGRYDFWIAMVGLHKIGAGAIPATSMLRAKDNSIQYR
ncbi:AMP-binding protein [Methanotrichaceae archaeon Mx]|uniref:AMP-binding protein n=1 Tax=Candidatus Methanocrinis natronophilus TaxID=3033396 RepID=A0ABT5X7X7_9EURY|nr:AMP-binding protein [Candidatus Methanocrinis natronophilus]MDF0590786.1 AMP-binding protein [Candidatus Methanocrinis natronophilus]